MSVISLSSLERKRFADFCTMESKRLSEIKTQTERSDPISAKRNMVRASVYSIVAHDLRATEIAAI